MEIDKSPTSSVVAGISKRMSFAAIFILILAGCSDDKDPRVLTPPPGNIKISVSVSPKYIRIKERADILISATNHGPDPVELNFHCKDHLGYRLEAEGGQFTFSSPGFCDVGPHKLILEPGQTETLTEQTPVDLPAYQYIVKAGMLEHEDEFPWATSRLTVHW